MYSTLSRSGGQKRSKLTASDVLGGHRAYRSLRVGELQRNWVLPTPASHAPHGSLTVIPQTLTASD
jgi:hypothetical protein